MKPAVDRFLDRIRIDGDCWLWTGSTDGRQGYAKMSVDGESVRVIRWVFELFNPGKKLRKHHVVGHTCDRPACVAPHHLVRMTHRQNMKDKAKKGRVVNNKRFLDAETVSLIRFANQLGHSPLAIAKEIGLKYMTVRSITEGKRWKNIA